MVKSNRENNPNAGLFISALRNLGYNNLSAINDIIDNALDADASRVVVMIQEKHGKVNIDIVDDGFAMNEAVLDEALRLGSDVERNVDMELGKFGMGLSTASISISRRLEVLTSVMDADRILKSSQDIDEIYRENAFIKYLGEPAIEDINYYETMLGDKKHGTIIRLVDCDKLTNKNINAFSARLIKEIGRTFREYINAGRAFYVNGKKVEAEDIFMLSDGGEIYSDDEYEVVFKDENNEEKKETVRVRLGILPDFGPTGNTERKINAANQGFYVMRNNREIEKGATLGFYTRHPQFNRFRGEIYFSASLDEKMGVNFQKNGVNLEQSVHDKISQDVKHQIAAIGRQIRKGMVAKEAEKVNHQESERVINKKAPLLKTPKPEDKEPKQTKKEEEKKQKNKNKDKEKEPRKERQDERVRFTAEHQGKAGHIYEARMEGKVAVIAWNVDHPFYERFVVGTQEDKTLSTSIDFLVYSLATAELNIMNDQTLDMIEEFKNIMALNLNTLLR